MRPYDIFGSSGSWEDYVPKLFSNDCLKRLRYSIQNQNVGILAVEIDGYFPLMKECGEEIGFSLIERFDNEIEGNFASFFEDCGLLCVEKPKINGRIVCFEFSGKYGRDLLSPALSFRLNLRKSLSGLTHYFGDRKAEVLAGCSGIEKGGNGDFSWSLFNAFYTAQETASWKIDPAMLELYREFIEISDSGSIECLYQPVLDFRSGEIRGWEAFVQGPRGSRLHDMSQMLDKVAETAKVFDLEKKSREKAIRGLGDVPPGKGLFLNVHRRALSDPEFTCDSLMQLVREAGLSPENTVLELSEKDGFEVSSHLLQAVEQLRNRGFRISIDGVGAGRATLHSISQIRPDFIKIDDTLIKGVDCNPFKRVMIETLIVMAEKVGCQVIAQGIETESELSSVVSMGIHMGQGKYLGLPAFPKSALSSIEIPVAASFDAVERQGLKCLAPVKELVRETLHVPPETLVQEVKKMMENQPPMSSVAIVKEGSPAGLLMNYNLDRNLGTQYGVSLYYHRSVSSLMDGNPLIVEAGTPVEQVAQAAMNRDAHRVYDDIVITEKGKFIGTVSVQKMLDALARVQVEMAKGANPLTGLPGNVAIEKEINRRANAKLASSLIYVDLDNFKVFNDAYGFEKGDRVLLFTSKVLTEAVNTMGRGDDFVGHIGGDDFVIICEPASAEALCSKIIGLFGEGAPGYYSQQDSDRGYIVGMGRDGTENRFPLLSVSIGIVECEFKNSIRMEELGHRVAEVKKYAKSVSGNCCVRDRRLPLGADSETGVQEKKGATH